MVQLSHLYMTAEKTIALTIHSFVGKVISLLLNMLSRFVIAFLPRSQHLLVSCLKLISLEEETANHCSILAVMLKILHARLQQYVNRELPDVQAGFRKGRGTRDQIANIRWIIKKAREFQKNIYFCFIDYAKPLD